MNGVAARLHSGKLPDHEVGEGGGRALGGARLGQEGWRSSPQAQGRQVHAFFEELPGRGLGCAALVRVRPGDRDGRRR